MRACLSRLHHWGRSSEAAQRPDLVRKFIIGGEAAGFEDWQTAVSEQSTDPIATKSWRAYALFIGHYGETKGYLPSTGEHLLDAPHPLKLAGMYFGFNDSTVYLSPAPLYHSAPLFYNTLNMTGGGTSVIMERFDQSKPWPLSNGTKRLTASGCRRCLSNAEAAEEARSSYDVSSMRCAIHAAAPCPIDINIK